MLPHRLTPDITLRILQPHHAPELFKLVDRNRDDLRRRLPWLDNNTSEEDTLAFINSALRGFADNGAFTCGIWHNADLCGVIGFNTLDRANHSARVGYWLDAQHRGKGIMTACCRALVDHAFSELDLHRIVIAVATDNHASQAIPDRLGFTKEGIEREAEWLYDRFVDFTINVLLRPDAQAGR
ncbi:MAG: GNAT family N-acetyltransferase [Phycisphaerales bacterium]|nr:GNAT family N-acetyltransferase [Phycisphaerales bacterium]